MNQINEKDNKQDHALAQLLVHAPRNVSSSDYGEEASMEELAMLAEGKLSDQRRTQVLNQLNDNSALYETWMMLQEFSQCEALSTASESVNLTQGQAQTEQQISSDSLQQNSQRQQQKQPSLIERITAWFNELFSWHGAFATSFGIALGVVFMMQAGLNDDYEIDLQQHGIAIHAPMQPPQKASVDTAPNSVIAKPNAPVQSVDQSDISQVEVVKIEGNTIHFKVTLKSGEEYLETYVPAFER